MRQLLAVHSTDRRNTLGKVLSFGSILQGVAGSFVQLSCDSIQLGLRVEGQIGSEGQILPEQSVGVLFDSRCQGDC